MGKIIGKQDTASNVMRIRSAPASHRVAHVGVNVVLDVLENFIEVAGACRTQEAGVTISLRTHTHTHTYTYVQ